MRSGPPVSMLSVVTSTRTHITIDASVDASEIRGQISCETGETRQFTGWLALISALDDLLTRPAADHNDQTTPAAGDPG